MSQLIFPVPSSHWIPREHHRPVVEALLPNKVIAFDNARNLPLTSGGKTDIYFDVRVARSRPAAGKNLIQLCSGPMRWLRDNAGVARFLEVPEAVSGLAGALSSAIDMPYVTIRKVPKEGRAESLSIGELNLGDSVVLFDDVITDGASKMPAIEICRKRGINLKGMLVFCDRQQGWQKKFAENGIDLPVWPGLTLHDIRRELIAMGVMQRCDPTVEEQNRLIIALDGKSWLEYLTLIDVLRPTGCILKVNDMAFAEGIVRLVPELSVYGRVMVDLKCHDIPNTVANTCKHFLACLPWAVTAHASGGGSMVAAARKTLGPKPHVLAITVLTSIGEKKEGTDQTVCEEIYGRRPLEQVLNLAKIAWDNGASGFVCAPEETVHLRSLYPKAVILNPGVRSPGQAAQDQKRVGTIAAAFEAGADFAVVGRQITDNNDPAKEAVRINREGT